MNLETLIDKKLWDNIKDNFEKNSYTDTIKDSIFYLSNLIRDKSGLDNDGVALIGQAFGGKDPILKVNRLQSETEINIQKGVEQLLRGIYQAIRNPRSHEKYSDSLNDTIAIIVFINYIANIIDQSKAPFTKNEFLKRVFDSDFVENERYADLLVSEIPKKHLFDIFIDVFRHKEKGDGNKLNYFFNSLMKKLSEDEKKQIYEIISEELKITNDTIIVTLNLQIINPNHWKKIEETARLRIENKLINSIKNGEYDFINMNSEGAFGTRV